MLHPADAKVKADKNLTVEANGKDAQIWVVMKVGTGTAPDAKVSGTGLASTLEIDGKTISYDQSSQRITAK